jgi:hypothetical protein
VLEEPPVPEEDTPRGGWLPPRAPGAADPPRYEPGREGAPRWQPPPAPSDWTPAEPAAEPEAEAEPARAPAPTAAPRGERPVFVTGAGQRDAGATVAVTLAIIALALLLLSIGAGFWLTLPLSGIALHLGRRARDRAQVDGRSQANAGMVLGMVGVVLGLLAAIGWIVAIIFLGYGPSDLQHDLQRELDRQSREAFIHAALALFGR